MPSSDDSAPRLDIVTPCSADADSKSIAYLDRFAASTVLTIPKPGTYAFCVAAQDPEEQLGQLKLTTAFASRIFPKDGDPDEDEPDPEPKGAYIQKSDAIAEQELDPRFPMHRALNELCWLDEDDDHGDTFSCATTLEPGRAALGELANGWGDDEDLFVFRLDELQTVEIETSGEIDTAGDLFNRFRQRLDSDDDNGEGDNFRIVKTLEPGWYFARVAGQHSEGSYQLSVDILDR